MSPAPRPQGGQELPPGKDGMGGLFQLGIYGGRTSNSSFRTKAFSFGWALVQVPFLLQIQILGAPL